MSTSYFPHSISFNKAKDSCGCWAEFRDASAKSERCPRFAGFQSWIWLWGLSGILNAPLSHEDGAAILKEAFNKGITFFDTADIYGKAGDNEIMIGKALKELPREQVQVASKFGLYMPDGMSQVHVKGSPEYVRKCIEASLTRLDVDYIDLYYPHRVDTSVPIEETMGELKKLVEEGKIRYIGLSEASTDTIKKGTCCASYHCCTNGVFSVESELGIGIVAYSPLGHGFFGGKGVVESLPSQSVLVNVAYFY
ncbi:UNVERIFIED_CONTAM: putative aldo-keto reductase 1 [Sesamum calycinum]|uniref:Aldo-keto reductase 1 n=1 Tax=Sesamum calycinum TaxID=2727403 RepID=A0AAW2JUZ5_9LAMI